MIISKNQIQCIVFFKPGKKFDIKQKHVKNLAYIDYMNDNSVDNCVQWLQLSSTIKTWVSAIKTTYISCHKQLRGFNVIRSLYKYSNSF